MRSLGTSVARLRAEAPVHDAAAVGEVHLAEAHAALLHDRVELDGEDHLAKRDRPIPHRSRCQRLHSSSRGRVCCRAQYLPEQVATFCNPGQHVLGPEAEQLGILLLGALRHLGPVERGRDARPLRGPQRVHADGRLVLVVLAPVDQHLAAALGLRHARDDQLRVALLEQPGDGVGEGLGLLVGHIGGR